MHWRIKQLIRILGVDLPFFWNNLCFKPQLWLANHSHVLMSSYNNVRSCYESTITCQHPISSRIVEPSISMHVFTTDKFPRRFTNTCHVNSMTETRKHKWAESYSHHLVLSSTIYTTDYPICTLLTDLAFRFVKLFCFQLLPLQGFTTFMFMNNTAKREAD